MPRPKSSSPTPHIKFSIIHACSGPASGWYNTFQAWTSNAAHPETIEYILVVDNTRLWELSGLESLLNRPKDRRFLHVPDTVGMFKICPNPHLPIHADRFFAGLLEACVGSLKIAVTDLSVMVGNSWDEKLSGSLAANRQLFLKDKDVAADETFVDVARECENLFYTLTATPEEVNSLDA